MTYQNQIRVQLDNDQAFVATAAGGFHVSQRDKSNAISSCPMQLMLGSLGACIMLTLNAVAKNKGITLEHTDVRLDYSTSDIGGTRFQVTLKLDDHLTDRERRILYQSARICEVGKILKSDVQIEYQLQDPVSPRSDDSDAIDPRQHAAGSM